MPDFEYTIRTGIDMIPINKNVDNTIEIFIVFYLSVWYSFFVAAFGSQSHRYGVPVLVLLLFMLSQTRCPSTVTAIIHTVTGPVSQYCYCYCSCCHRSSGPVLLLLFFMLSQVQCPSTVSAIVYDVTGPVSQYCYCYCSCCHRSRISVLLLLLFMLSQVQCPVLLLLLFMLSQVQCPSTGTAIVHAVTGPVSQYCYCYCSCCHRSRISVLLLLLFMLSQVQCPSTVSARIE
jgi:hypothetical protein